MENTIRDIREQYHLTLRQISERFNIPLRTVENWSSGKNTPPDYVIGMMVEILSK